MTIFSIAGGTQANASASGGKVYAFNTLSTAPQQVAGMNPQRRRITFVNPHATIIAFVAPTVTATGAALTPTTTALGGCFPVFPGGLLIIEGECQIPWQAFSASGSGNPLTIMDSNI